jgi:hypothetical protein
MYNQMTDNKKSHKDAAASITARAHVKATGQKQTAAERERELAEELGVSRLPAGLNPLKQIVDETCALLGMTKGQLAYELLVSPQALSSWEAREFIPKRNFKIIEELREDTPLHKALVSGELAAREKHVQNYLRVINAEDGIRREEARKTLKKSLAGGIMSLAKNLPAYMLGPDDSNEKRARYDSYIKARTGFMKLQNAQVDAAKEMLAVDYHDKRANFWSWFPNEERSHNYKPPYLPFFQNEHVTAEVCTIRVAPSSTAKRPLLVDTPTDFYEALTKLLLAPIDPYTSSRWLYVVIPTYLLDDDDVQKAYLREQANEIIGALKKAYLDRVTLHDEIQVFGHLADTPQDAHKPRVYFPKVEIKLSVQESLEDVVFDLCNAEKAYDKAEEEMWAAAHEYWEQQEDDPGNF